MYSISTSYIKLALNQLLDVRESFCNVSFSSQRTLICMKLGWSAPWRYTPRPHTNCRSHQPPTSPLSWKPVVIVYLRYSIPAMPPTHRSLLRVAILTLAVIGLCNFYHGISIILSFPPVRKLYNVLSSAYPDKRILRDLGMTEEQCRATFPGLMTEIDDSVKRGPFELERQKNDYTGLVQGRIDDGKVRFENLLIERSWYIFVLGVFSRGLADHNLGSFMWFLWKSNLVGICFS